MRKIEKIQTLDQQTAKLKAENEDLAKFANKLKDQVTKNHFLIIYIYFLYIFSILQSH